MLRVANLSVCTAGIGDVLKSSFRIQAEALCNLRDSGTGLVHHVPDTIQLLND